MTDTGIGVLLWLILAALGAVLVCLHSVVYHLLRCHAAQCRGLWEFRQLVDSIQDTLTRVNAGLVQVHERYLILQRDAKKIPAREKGFLFGPHPWPPEGGVRDAICGLSRSLPPGGNLALSEVQVEKLREALHLTREVQEEGVRWKTEGGPNGPWPAQSW